MESEAALLTFFNRESYWDTRARAPKPGRVADATSILQDSL